MSASVFVSTRFLDCIILHRCYRVKRMGGDGRGWAGCAGFGLGDPAPTRSFARFLFRGLRTFRGFCDRASLQTRELRVEAREAFPIRRERVALFLHDLFRRFFAELAGKQFLRAFAVRARLRDLLCQPRFFFLDFNHPGERQVDFDTCTCVRCKCFPTTSASDCAGFAARFSIWNVPGSSRASDAMISRCDSINTLAAPAWACAV